MHQRTWTNGQAGSPGYGHYDRPGDANYYSATASRPARQLRLRATNVSKQFGRRQVLRNVCLELHAGEVVAVIGANGAGKSTFLKICAGLISPSSGEVLVNGSIGYCPQTGGTFDFLRPAEHFVLFGRARGLKRKAALSRGQEIAGLLDWRPDEKTQSRHLSGGNRQKLNVILSVLGGHDVLLLDEPYQGFDKGSYTDFWDVVWRLRGSGHAVMVITHMLNDLDKADQVLDLTPADVRGTR